MKNLLVAFLFCCCGISIWNTHKAIEQVKELISRQQSCVPVVRVVLTPIKPDLGTLPAPPAGVQQK